jgi:hypothetical protein
MTALFRTHCPICGWVKPLHPKVSMASCPCGWSQVKDEEHIVQVIVEVVEVVSFATVAA